MPRDKLRDISRMPTEAGEAPAYVQGEQAERQQGPPEIQCGGVTWRRDVAASLRDCHGPSLPQLSCADVTRVPG